jgi:ribonuclease HII
MYPELSFIEKNQKWPMTLVGVDEVGRGPLAGPVVVCSSMIKIDSAENFFNIFEWLREQGVQDSKKISTHAKRIQVMQSCGYNLNELEYEKNLISKNNNFQFESRLIAISPQLIDDLNILHASLLGMEKCLIPFQNSYAFVDGNKNPFDSKVLKEKGLIGDQKSYQAVVPVIKGDSLSPLIGLASVIAKVARDHMMEQYSIEYPQYGLHKHAGYPTKEHLQAIQEFGITPIHRKTFKGVKEYVR